MSVASYWAAPPRKILKTLNETVYITHSIASDPSRLSYRHPSVTAFTRPYVAGTVSGAGAPGCIERRRSGPLSFHSPILPLTGHTGKPRLFCRHQIEPPSFQLLPYPMCGSFPRRALHPQKVSQHFLQSAVFAGLPLLFVGRPPKRVT